jgi:2-polyprenyl-6-methoxyphenol hydroxylase-like FAD-dependent oxidoreductase
MTMNNRLGKHAVVLGGGMAGLLTARVLTDFFEQVSLVERDRYPDEPVFRAGVPQGRHVHILLAGGQKIIEELFPGIEQDLMDRGASQCDFGKDYRVRWSSGWLPRSPSQLRGWVCTRMLLEWQIRQALVKDSRVRIVDGYEVVGVMASEDARSITGVSLRARARSQGDEQGLTELTGDLVVDATGRESKAPEWLKALGYAAPPETSVNPYLGYASRFYAPAEDVERDWKGMIIQASPPGNLRGGVILPIEGGQWHVVLSGTGKDYPPTDEDGFLEFARSLADPALFEAIKGAEPLSPIYGYRRTENRLRHFERLQQLPEGLIVLGDAACAFNPVYGQGMTVAALGAVALRECLRLCGRNGLEGLPLRFQRKLARVNMLPWTLATASDRRVPTVEGEKVKRGMRWRYWYLSRLLQRLPTRPLIARNFSKVLHMVESPAVLFQPPVVVQVLLPAKK